MTRVITYDLRVEGENSESYYQVAKLFTQEWFETLPPDIRELMDGFVEERRKRGLPARAPISCAYDLLVLGVLMLEHGSEAEGLSRCWGILLQRLIHWQARFPRLERVFKKARGLLIPAPGSPKPKENQRTRLGAVLDWLQATGEDTQAKRLGEWQEYFQSIEDEKGVIQRLEAMGRNFSTTSQERLGKYTGNVEAFLRTEAKEQARRYDAALLQHTRLEYHLAMVGTAILNVVNREEFLRTKRKIVILPPCMRALEEAACKATMTENGAHCAGCTPHCRIHQVTRLGEKHGFAVYIIPDEIRGYARDGEREKVGLVGVSCVLTNWGGGWDAERLGISAQGVLLDYVGCKYHWDKHGFPTDINIKQLLACLNIQLLE